ncbi:MAG: hypothetical protein KAI44_04555 [Methylococcales bacterium]|nr:hypothetical protein [Methylococcales bacterium]
MKMYTAIKNFAAATLTVGLVLYSTSWAVAQGQSETKRFFGIGEPLTAEELPAGNFRKTLLTLSPQARANALNILRQSNTPVQDFVDMRVDERGFIHYVDPAPDEAVEGAEEPALPSDIAQADVFKLHSKPGAANVLYIDFDGHNLIDTRWNVYSGQTVLYMRPFDLDGDHTTFSQTEINRIAESWRRVAEDFAPFDIDVTTEEPPFTLNPTTGRIEYATNVGHNLVTRQQDDNGYWVYTQGGCGCGGVAYLRAFGNTYYQPGLSFNRGISSNALTISHETGHNLGLGHDGTSSKGYYSGHGSDETEWGPIMGAPWGVSLSQWSRDEYPDANNPEDDFMVIDNYLTFRSDDHEDITLAAATPLLVTGGINVASPARVSDPSWIDLANKGIIEDRNDIDLFSMNIGVGTIDLTIDPAKYEVYEGSQGANLDIEVKLLDESGGVLLTSNPDLFVGASINYAVTVAGTYYLEVTGVGRAGTGGSDYGHSNYASVGQYYINGTIPEDILITIPPTAPSNLTTVLVNDSSIELSWADPATLAEADEAGYRVLRSVNGDAFGLRASLPRDSTFFADNNLDNGDYVYKLEVFNSLGTAETSPTTPITVDVPNVAVATSENTALGSIVSGTYASTQQALGFETLSEESSGGKPSQRFSYLDHSLLVTGVVPGASVELYINASAQSNGESDDFEFSYAVNGAVPVVIGTLLQGMSKEFTVALDPTISGTVEVNVVDTNRSQGRSARDTVTIREISITSSGDPAEQPPVTAILTPANETTVPSGTILALEATANDYEDGDLGSSIMWNSDLQGYLGTGSSIMVGLSGGTPATQHIVTAEVTDSAGISSSTSIVVNIDDTPTSTTMSVSDLDATGIAMRGGKWKALVTVKVNDDLGDAVTGVDVTGSWSNGSNGSNTCTSDTFGQCTFTMGGLKSNIPSVDLTVTGIAGTLAYAPEDNIDPDDDSDGTTITVTGP